MRALCRKCGKKPQMLDSERCEDCWAEDQARHHGKPQTVQTDRIVVRGSDGNRDS